MNVFEYVDKHHHDEDFEHKPASEPTSALPGSPEKVSVMIQRVERGENPIHPADARIEDNRLFVPPHETPNSTEDYDELDNVV